MYLQASDRNKAKMGASNGVDLLLQARPFSPVFFITFSSPPGPQRTPDGPQRSSPSGIEWALRWWIAQPIRNGTTVRNCTTRLNTARPRPPLFAAHRAVQGARARGRPGAGARGELLRRALLLPHARRQQGTPPLRRLGLAPTLRLRLLHLRLPGAPPRERTSAYTLRCSNAVLFSPRPRAVEVC